MPPSAWSARLTVLMRFRSGDDAEARPIQRPKNSGTTTVSPRHSPTALFGHATGRRQSRTVAMASPAFVVRTMKSRRYFGRAGSFALSGKRSLKLRKFGSDTDGGARLESRHELSRAEHQFTRPGSRTGSAGLEAVASIFFPPLARRKRAIGGAQSRGGLGVGTEVTNTITSASRTRYGR